MSSLESHVHCDLIAVPTTVRVDFGNCYTYTEHEDNTLMK